MTENKSLHHVPCSIKDLLILVSRTAASIDANVSFSPVERCDARIRRGKMASALPLFCRTLNGFVASYFLCLEALRFVL